MSEEKPGLCGHELDDQGTPDLLTWEGDEPGDGDNTEVAWGTVSAYGAGE